MPRQRALWIPFWHALDQSLEVGATSNLDFFHEPPAALAAGGHAVLYHGDWSTRGRFYSARYTVVAMTHAVLGSLRAIDAQYLDYAFTLADGRTIAVNAEEQPGTAAGLPAPIADWRVMVDLDSA